MTYMPKAVEWQRLTWLTIAISILASGCVAPNVYNIGVKRWRMEFQSVSIAPDGDVLLSGSLFENNSPCDVYAYEDARALHDRIRLEFPKGGNAVQVRVPDRLSVNTGAWKIIPADLHDKDTAHGQVPRKFTSTTQVYSTANPVPYNDEGQIVFLKFHGLVNQWSKRAAWSYPCQILLIPAAAIDLAVGVVWVPIWLIFFSHEH